MATETSESQQLIFDQGHAVGREAQKRFPGGILVDAPHTDVKLALAQTDAAIQAGAPAIFEATFVHNGVLVKTDILERKSKSEWNLIEVKSSTRLKDVYVTDVAVQLWVLRGAGLKIKAASVLHINNQCVYPNLDDLFTEVIITQEATALSKRVSDQVSAFQAMLAKKAPPLMDLGPHCDAPYECGFKDHCWGAKDIPSPGIFDIPGLSTAKKWAFYQDGLLNLRDLDPKEFNEKQSRMITHSVSGTRYLDPKAIQKAISKWEYPFSYLDFETIGYAIPRYKGTRSYEQIPFQLSCHIQKTANGKTDHVEYLHLDESDPRESVAQTLVDAIPKHGSVIAYNMGFEKQILLALAETFSKHKKELRQIASRLVDPLPIVRAHVYDPAFCGSFSIKAVAPALLGKTASYKGMSVGNGSEAQIAFLEMINRSTPAKRKTALKKGLLEYCKKDTQGMVDIVEWLIDV